LIINTTEAMISIDVNSGKATRERSITETALKINLEAAVEIARQCRLRDLAGLIVVDFIDMAEKRNNVQVEKYLRDALREDKAKIQIGNISNFGLLEFSRQRLRSSIADANMIICPHCSGTGFTWSSESVAIQVLRKIEETVSVLISSEILVTLSVDVATYLVNNKRSFISSMEERSGSKIIFKIDGSIPACDFKIEQSSKNIEKEDAEESSLPPVRKATFGKKKERNEEESCTNESKKNENEEEDTDEKTTEVVSLPLKTELKKNNRNRKRRRRNNNTENSSTAELVAVDLSDQPPEKKEENVKEENIIEKISEHLLLTYDFPDFSKVDAINVFQREEYPQITSTDKTTSEHNRSSKKRKNIWWQKIVKKPE
jgi:ribonuclease E